MKENMADRRSEIRHPCNVKVEYSFIEPLECDKGGPQPWKTFTTDLSFSGMGFLSECPARVGQKVMVNLEFLFKAPRMAEVKWCEKTENDLYRLGVRFF